MKNFRYLVYLLLSVAYSISAYALEIKDYSAEAFGAAKTQNRSFIVLFHATWCPTCGRQEKSLNNLKSDPALEKILILKADYDSTEELQNALKVRRQSTMVGFKGVTEVARAVGITKEPDVAEFLKKTL